MTNWKYWPPLGNRNTLNYQLGNVEAIGPFNYPNLRDYSDFILASDYSGEHQQPEFQVLSFLLTPRSSVVGDWDPARLNVRKKHFTDQRRMSFKRLDDVQRINALNEFIEAASLLNGVLVCVGVEKAHTLRDRIPIEHFKHNWTSDTLEKLLRICMFGSGFVDGLRGNGQNLFWITDDDAIVATENAQEDASSLMGSLLHTYPTELPQLNLGIASKFDDDLRAEDLVAIPDLAAGAFSESLTELRKENIPTIAVGPSNEDLFLQTCTF